MVTLVTGGTGFLGVNLVRALVASGERVRALVRPKSRHVGLESPAIELVTGDVTDADSIGRAMTGCDRVYHVAGWVRIGTWGSEIARAVNVTGTENVCRAALEHGVQRVVHTSSIATIGHSPIDSPATEASEWNLGGLRSPYHITKRQAEGIVHRYIERGLDAVIVNPSYTIGPYDVKPSSGRMILLYAARKLRGYPTCGGIGFVDVREVVEGMRLAMERGRCGERYILSHTNMTYRRYARRVARISGVPPPWWPAPSWLLYLPACLGSGLGQVFPSAFADFNLTVWRTCFCEHYVSSEKARRELGVKPWPIDQAIADALEWFDQHGYIRRTSTGWRLLGSLRAWEM